MIKTFREFITEQFDPYEDLIDEIRERAYDVDAQTYSMVYEKIMSCISMDEFSEVKKLVQKLKQIDKDVLTLNDMVKSDDVKEALDFYKKNDAKKYKDLTSYVLSRAEPKYHKMIKKKCKGFLKLVSVLNKLKSRQKFSLRDYQYMGEDELVRCYDGTGKEIYSGMKEDSPIDYFEEKYKDFKRYELASKNLILVSSKRLDTMFIDPFKNEKLDYEFLIIERL